MDGRSPNAAAFHLDDDADRLGRFRGRRLSSKQEGRLGSGRLTKSEQNNVGQPRKAAFSLFAGSGLLMSAGPSRHSLRCGIWSLSGGNSGTRSKHTEPVDLWVRTHPTQVSQNPTVNLALGLPAVDRPGSGMARYAIVLSAKDLSHEIQTGSASGAAAPTALASVLCGGIVAAITIGR